MIRSRFSGRVLTLYSLVLVGLLSVCSGLAQQPASPKPQSAQSAAPAKTFTVRVTDIFTPTHWMPKLGLVAWMARITALTNGQIKFQHYHSGQLGKLGDALTMLKTKVSDIGYVPPASFTGELPLNNVLLLPGTFSTADQGTKVYQTLIKQPMFENEFLKQGIRPLVAVTNTPQELLTRKVPITKLEDLKGIKLRVAGGPQESVLKALGGVPVVISGNEMYTAIERGTVDGTFIGWSAYAEWKIEELVKYGTEGAALGNFALVYAIREELWNEFPQNVKDAFAQATNEIITKMGEEQDKLSASEMKKAEALGIKVNRLSKEEQARWSQRLMPIWDQWAKNMNSKALPGTQAVEALKKALGR